MASRVKVKNNSGKAIQTIEAGSKRAVEAAGRLLAGEVRKALLRGSRSGKVYNVPGSDVEYRASAPGEAPAPRTGELASSYRHVMVGQHKVRVGSDVPQAKLEFGYGHAAPRPHLRPSMEEIKPKLAGLFPGEFE